MGPLKRIFSETFVHLFLAAVIVGAIGYSVMQSNEFAIQKIVLIDEDGGQVPDYLENSWNKLETELQNKFLNKKLFWISRDDVLFVSEKGQWFDHVSISRRLLETLEIRVRVKRATAALRVDSSQAALVGEDGRLLLNVPWKLVPDVVWLVGEKFRKDDQTRRQAIALYKKIPSLPLSVNLIGNNVSDLTALKNNKTILHQARVSEISIEENGDFSLILGGRATKIIMGHEDFSVRLARVEKVLNYLHMHGIYGRVIDTNYQKKVLVRLRKRS